MTTEVEMIPVDKRPDDARLTDWRPMFLSYRNQSTDTNKFIGFYMTRKMLIIELSTRQINTCSKLTIKIIVSSEYVYVGHYE